MQELNIGRRSETGIQVGREELEVLLELINDRNRTPAYHDEADLHCLVTRGLLNQTSAQSERKQEAINHLQLLTKVSSIIEERVRLNQQLHNLLKDIVLLTTDKALQIVRVFEPETISSAVWQHRLKGLAFKPGMWIDEWNFGAQAFSFARYQKRVRAVWGLEHSCPNLKEVWTVAAPIKIGFNQLHSDIIGYAGMMIDARKDIEGYAVWLLEMLASIVEEIITERNWIKTFNKTRPSVAVRLPNVARQSLTPRELEVLTLLISGLNITTVAQQLFIEKSTVKTYIRRITEKFNIEHSIGALLHYIDTMNLEDEAIFKAQP